MEQIKITAEIMQAALLMSHLHGGYSEAQPYRLTAHVL